MKLKKYTFEDAEKELKGFGSVVHLDEKVAGKLMEEGYEKARVWKFVGDELLEMQPKKEEGRFLESPTKGLQMRMKEWEMKKEGNLRKEFCTEILC